MRLRTRLFLSFRYRLPDFKIGIGFSELLLDHIPPHVYFDRWSIQPFNGQAERWSTISAVAKRFKGTHAIETGTYLGSSTPYISSLVSGSTFTIEINAETVKKTRKRFEQNHAERNIHLIQGDSVQEIKKILQNIDPVTSRVLAYLDAHWLDKIPTTEEIISLAKWGGPWIAIIDDFNVPSDNGYGFDHYGDVIIGPAIVPKLEGLHVYVPSGPSNRETGVARGTGYIFNSAAMEIVVPDDFQELVEVK